MKLDYKTCNFPESVYVIYDTRMIFVYFHIDCKLLISVHASLVSYERSYICMYLVISK